MFAIASLSAAGCSRNESSASATTTVVAALNASPKTSDFVIEAQNSVRLQTGGMVVNGGDIGALGTSGPFLADSAAVDALTGVQVQATHNIIAASVNLGTGAQVGDVQTRHLVTGTGATHGSVSALVPLPALPAAVAVSPGTTNLTVATGATVTASAGHFATISVGTGSTLKLGAGAYDMTTLTLSTGAKLQALGAVQIHVAGKITTSSGAIIGPASGVTLTASGIRIEVSGQNGSTGALTATPPAASFGTGNNVTALILVPNGTLAFGTGAIAKGAFMGRDVDLGGAGAPRSRTRTAFRMGRARRSPAMTATLARSTPVGPTGSVPTHRHPRVRRAAMATPAMGPKPATAPGPARLARRSSVPPTNATPSALAFLRPAVRCRSSRRMAPPATTPTPAQPARPVRRVPARAVP